MIFFIKSVEYMKQILLQTFYIQVCYMLASQETVDREFGNLQMIKDSHPVFFKEVKSYFLSIAVR